MSLLSGEHMVPAVLCVRRAVRWLGACTGLCFGVLSGAAQTCPCPEFKLPAVVAQADIIFVGKSLSATTDSSALSGGRLPAIEFQTRLLFDVETVIKGKAPRFVEVVTPTSSCAFPFAVGKTYLVLGKRQGGAVSTDACQGNVSGNDAIDDRVDAIRDELHR